jgi:hypothetical protein
VGCKKAIREQHESVLKDGHVHQDMHSKIYKGSGEIMK